MNELHRCHRYRIGYLAKTRPGEFFWSSITRIEMENGYTTNYDFGPGCLLQRAGVRADYRLSVQGLRPQ